ncbi:MAG: hypothetical protein JRG91_09015 [Deltaproteobacteria bacterium]|nr:hypothetical protein [Deltaproteobacteria bacterium]
MKRMIKSLEGEGFRVEFAEEYNGYIVAGQGEDPAVMLLDADAIEGQRQIHPGSAGAFVEGILKLVQSQISAQGSSSLQPPTEVEEAEAYADVPSDPPSAVGVEEDMIVDEEPDGEGVEAAVEEHAEEDVAFDEEPVEDAAGEDVEEPPAGDEPAGDAAQEPSEKEMIEEERTEELSLEDFDQQEE